MRRQILTATAFIACLAGFSAFFMDSGDRAPQPAGLFRDMSPEAGAESVILFFYNRGCPECEQVEGDLLPAILEREGVDPGSLQKLDIADPGVMERLVFLEQKMGFHAPNLAPVLVISGKAFCGIGEIENYLAAKEFPEIVGGS